MRKKKGLKMKSDSPSCLRRPRATCSIIEPKDKAIAYILGLTLYRSSLIQEKFQKKEFSVIYKKIYKF